MRLLITPCKWEIETLYLFQCKLFNIGQLLGSVFSDLEHYLASTVRLTQAAIFWNYLTQRHTILRPYRCISGDVPPPKKKQKQKYNCKNS